MASGREENLVTTDYVDDTDVFIRAHPRHPWLDFSVPCHGRQSQRVQRVGRKFLIDEMHLAEQTGSIEPCGSVSVPSQASVARGR